MSVYENLQMTTTSLNHGMYHEYYGGKVLHIWQLTTNYF